MWKEILKAQYMAGDYVTYKGLSKEQIRYAGDDPFGLEVGETYQLESVDVQKWKTYFTIKGVKGRFNSLGFELDATIAEIREPERAADWHLDNMGE